MKKIAISLFKKFFSYQKIYKFIDKLIDIYSIDVNSLYYNKKGILKFQNEFVSGEHYVIDKVLTKILTNDNVIIFDVGANVGNYSISIVNHLIVQKVYSFEPNPITFEQLKNNTKSFKNIHVINAGLGDKNAAMEIYTYKDEQTTEHASLYKTVLTELHKKQEIDSINVNIYTIDSFCNKENINQIDFLKIDTEGHEFAALEGAKEMLNNDKIKIIQFEFNEMNVISRVFLKDFYEILSDFNIFRMDSNRLIYLPVYYPSYEIFQFQNFLAIHKNIDIKNIL